MEFGILMRFLELFENHHIIDNIQGWGAVPDNQEVDYKGLRVQMKPSTFIQLAAPLGKDADQKIVDYIKQGGKIGSPFLIIEVPADWEEGIFRSHAQIVSHEGRNRMQAILQSQGDKSIETHLFFTQGLRNRHLTPEFIKHLNAGLLQEISQDLVKGPLFSVM